MGIFDFFRGKKNSAAHNVSPFNPWPNTNGVLSNPTAPSDFNQNSAAIANTDFSNGNGNTSGNGTSTSSNATQIKSSLGSPMQNQSNLNQKNNPNNAVPQAIIGNGEEIILGYGYASSFELSKRGYRDGITVQTLSDMNEGVSLVLAEYQAHLDKEIQRYEDEKDTCLRILARSGNICQQLDDQYDEIIHSQQRKIAKYEAYKLEVQKPEGQAAAIVTAYKRGYQAGVGKHRLYLTDTANPNKAD